MTTLLRKLDEIDTASPETFAAVLMSNRLQKQYEIYPELSSAYRQLVKENEELKDIVNHQSEMESLWCINPTISEAALQSALRHLHSTIEGDRLMSAHIKNQYWDMEE